MLGKLLKYEFKAVGRVLLPLYGALIIMSILLGFTAGFIQATFWLNLIITFLYTATAIAVVVFSIILLIQRFYKNLLGAEGYIMFTLPVKTSSHIINKTVSASTWVVAGTLVGLFSAMIIMMAGKGIGLILESIGSTFEDIIFVVGLGKTILIIIEVILLLALSGGEIALKIYAAISIGHQWTNHRVLGALLAYLGFGVIELIISSIIQIFNNDINILFEKINETGPFAAMQLYMLLYLGVMGIIIGIYYTITYKLISRRLNLE